MGQDDANVGGAGECPGHEFDFSRLVLVEQPGRLIPGMGAELECRFCHAVTYEGSQLEAG